MQAYYAHRFLDLYALISASIYLKIPDDRKSVLLPQTVNEMKQDADELSTELGSLGLKITKAATDRFLRELDDGKMIGEAVGAFVDDVESRFRDELAAISFFYVLPDRAKFYNNPKAFGEQVFERFPSAEYDIVQAGNCFAFECHTAMVMHSMRILEVGLTCLAHKLKVSRSNRGWGADLNAFNNRWQALLKSNPSIKGWKRAFYPQLFAEFRYFADAWRNRAFHSPAAQYGEEEARRVFEHVRDFMKVLATRFSEKKHTT